MQNSDDVHFFLIVDGFSLLIGSSLAVDVCCTAVDVCCTAVDAADGAAPTVLDIGFIEPAGTIEPAGAMETG